MIFVTKNAYIFIVFNNKINKISKYIQWVTKELCCKRNSHTNQYDLWRCKKKIMCMTSIIMCNSNGC